MATQNYSATKFANVIEPVNDGNNEQVKMYGSISDKAELKWDPIPFNSFGKIMRTNNKMVSTWIKHYYQQTFHDLKGVYVSYDASNGVFPVEFYFSKNILQCPDNKIENLIDITDPTGRDVSRNFFYKKQIIDNKTAGKKYELSDQTKILLADITRGGKAVNKPTSSIWKRPDVVCQFSQLVSDNTYNNRAVEILVRVANIFDFRTILRKLFGRTMISETVSSLDPDTGKAKMKNIVTAALYEARFIKPISNSSYEFIMNIEQFDEEQVKELSLKENPVRQYAPGTVIYW